MKQKWFFAGIGMIAFIFLGIFLIGTVIQLLWNWLMPDLFGLPSITTGQGVGLFILSRILFGGPFRKGRHYGKGYKKSWKSRMRNKWANMSPEERAKFKKGMRCGEWGEWKKEEKKDESSDLV